MGQDALAFACNPASGASRSHHTFILGILIYVVRFILVRIPPSHAVALARQRYLAVQEYLNSQKSLALWNNVTNGSQLNP